MKIDTTPTPLSTTNSVASGRQNRVQNKDEHGDEVHLNALNSLSNQVKALDSGTSEGGIDVQKVAAIKQAIAEGRFQINAGAIADGLIGTAQDLLRRQRQA